jgi:cell division septation protein DedD
LKTGKRTETKTKRNAVVVAPPSDNENTSSGPHKFFIQADAFTNKASAEQLVSDLQNKTRREWFIVFEDNLYKVRLGYFESKDEAKYAEGALNTPDITYYIDEIPEGNSEY